VGADPRGASIAELPPCQRRDHPGKSTSNRRHASVALIGTRGQKGLELRRVNQRGTIVSTTRSSTCRIRPRHRRSDFPPELPLSQPGRDTFVAVYRTPPSSCAVCGELVESNNADIVEFGTGYRCRRCTIAGEIAAHNERSTPSAVGRAIDSEIESRTPWTNKPKPKRQGAANTNEAVRAIRNGKRPAFIAR
jgi:hypothetical protein